MKYVLLKIKPDKHLENCDTVIKKCLAVARC